ncbi:phage tail domain-containing protein [Paenibacillus lutrae]|uniref:Phage tail protein n=1 Tax=Paenibacillus lutrae TaxID=2078573 RepID=A0A7X3K080_9BACL|nr:phage tail domain-containing protein [Paenibacillus lutrae]MVP00802.1 phage tail protein [Paenibacillus lutrae]
MNEGIHFYYDGIYSKDMGLVNCRLDSGFFEESFLPERELQEEAIRGQDKPYYQGVRHSPLSFQVTFAFEDVYDEEQIRKIARWLNTDYYKPFYTDANPEHIYYCMPVSDSQLIHNGLRQGYIKLTMRCDGPYAYSPQYTSRVYEWDETPIHIEQSSFQLGSVHQVVIDQAGKLSLNLTPKTWNSFPVNQTWNDL